MRLQELPFGSLSLFELAAERVTGLIPDSEVDLHRLDGGEVVLIPANNGSAGPIPVRGGSDGVQRKLDQLLSCGRPRICRLAQVSTQSVLLQIHEFVARHVWPEPLPIGLEEKATKDYQKRFRRGNQNPEAIPTQLKHRLVLAPASPARTERFFLSAGAAGSEETPNSFRLYGAGITVDVERTEDGKLVVHRLIARARAEAERIVLIEGALTFRDVSVAGVLAETARSQLDLIVEGANSYLDIWRKYSDFEKSRLVRMAKEIGVFAYQKWEPTVAGDLRFHVPGVSEDRLRDLRDACQDDGVPLQATSEMPDLEKFLEQEIAFVTGACRRGGVDLASFTITLSSDALSKLRPPEPGYLSLSQVGYKTAIARRDAAAEKIRTATCPMPQLGLLIEDQEVPVGKWRTIEPALTKRVRAQFKGDPTGVQELAISIAVNTPDIALIQGPPGTGKTQVIAAIVKRLEEEELADPGKEPAGAFLLTSYQHDAVDNVKERVSAYGLPAIKLGPARKQNTTSEDEQTAEKWRLNTAAHVSEQLKSCQGNERVAKYKELHDQVDAYAGGYRTLDETAQLLDKCAELSEDLAPSSVRYDVRALAAKLRQSSLEEDSPDHMKTNARAAAYQAALALRQSEAGFADDGPQRAADVWLLAGRAGIQLDASHRALLLKSAVWNPQLLPLRDKLVAQLAPDQRPEAIRLAPLEDVKQVLTKLLQAADSSIRGSADAIVLLLADYLHALQNEPRRVEAALAHYTAVLAETCQGVARREIFRLQEEWPRPGFETVIVDEAARANPLDLFIPMAQARRRIILVGDQKQLPHNLEPALEKEMLEGEPDENKEKLLKKPLFAQLFEQLQRRQAQDHVMRTIMLDTQFRMHPALGEFISQNFYGGELKSPLPPANFHHGLGQYTRDGIERVAVWIDVPHTRGLESKDPLNRSREAEVGPLIDEVRRIGEENPDLSIGVISFYKSQVRLLDAELQRLKQQERIKTRAKIQIGTVDSFQGREFDVVLLSMTRCNQLPLMRNYAGATAKERERSGSRRYGFLAVTNRMNVALSRQKRLVAVVGDARMLGQYAEADDTIAPLKNFYRFCGSSEYGLIL